LASWKNKISNPAQLGGIETSVIDNGPGRGTRIAWFNTGAGLRFKLLIDRGMDIGDAFYNQHSLAWLSHTGFGGPNNFANRGVEWLKSFGGGLVTTCGLTHVGGPESDEFGERGLHDQVNNLPAELESIIQPDPLSGNMHMSVTGLIRQTRVFGPSLELRRTISATLGRASLSIHDEVLNRANTPSPHMLLYHCNFGWPLVDEGTRIIWKGSWQQRHPGSGDTIFTGTNDFHLCPGPITEHLGTGESVAFIDADMDKQGICLCGLHNPGLGIALQMKYKKEQLPWLTNWQHWGAGEYVTAIEPGTHTPIGQAMARQLKELIFLQPGEKRLYDLEISLLTDRQEIAEFVSDTGQSS
jgi:hypothetical protein